MDAPCCISVVYMSVRTVAVHTVLYKVYSHAVHSAAAEEWRCV